MSAPHAFDDTRLQTLLLVHVFYILCCPRPHTPRQTSPSTSATSSRAKLPVRDCLVGSTSRSTGQLSAGCLLSIRTTSRFVRDVSANCVGAGDVLSGVCSICVCVCMYVYTCMYVCMRVCVHACVCVCACVCMYVLRWPRGFYSMIPCRAKPFVFVCFSSPASPYPRSFVTLANYSVSAPRDHRHR